MIVSLPSPSPLSGADLLSVTFSYAANSFNLEQLHKAITR